MSALTPEEKKRLSEKCEELSSLFAEGRGPRIRNSGGWRTCAAGLLMRAAGFDPKADNGLTANALDDLPFWAALTGATIEAVTGNPGALAFTYLAVRDALLEAP